MFKVLSIDGGGIRGTIPAVLLEQLERDTGKAVSELFDLVIGTSNPWRNCSGSISATRR